MSKFLLANITWNPYGWKKGYKNPKAGHKYARDHIPSESFNFKFNKIVDTKKFIYGFIEWSNAPIKFDKEGLIIFYTKNTDDKKNQLIGVYGKTEVIKRRYEIEGKNCSSNIRAEKAFSILFPIPLDADNYKTSEDMVVVGQNGFKYREKDYAKKVLFDELSELKKINYKENDFNKLLEIYEFYIGEKFLTQESNKKIEFDEDEQAELEKFYIEKFYKDKDKKSLLEEDKKSLLEELEELNKNNTDEKVFVKSKGYKRDNKAIALIKILRGFKCQICGTSIIKKDKSPYVEAAHVKPKCEKGRETPDNIILLCPNHHKEFDLGSRKIKYHDKDKIKFNLNGKEYTLELSLSSSE